MSSELFTMLAVVANIGVFLEKGCFYNPLLDRTNKKRYLCLNTTSKLST